MGIISQSVERDRASLAGKRRLLHDVRMGYCAVPEGKSQEEVIRILLAEIAFLEDLIQRYKGVDYA